MSGPKAGEPIEAREKYSLCRCGRSNSSVTLTAATDPGSTIVAIIGGRPAEQPILFSGPFVMNSGEHLTRAKHDYSSEKVGRLDGVPF